MINYGSARLTFALSRVRVLRSDERTLLQKLYLLLLPCMSVLFYYVQNPSVLLPLSVRGPGFIITFPSLASALRSRLSPPLLYWDAAADR